MKKLLLLLAIAITGMANAQTFEWQNMLELDQTYWPKTHVDASENSYYLKEISSNSVDINNQAVTVPYQSLGTNYRQFALIKVDKTGAFVWARNIAVKNNSGSSTSINLAGGSNNIFITIDYSNANSYALDMRIPNGLNTYQTYTSNGSTYSRMLVKLDSDGYLTWGKLLSLGFVQTLKEDTTTNHLYTCEADYSGGLYLKKYDNTGAEVFSHKNIISNNGSNKVQDFINGIFLLNNSSNFVTISPSAGDRPTTSGFAIKFDAQQNKIDSFDLPEEFGFVSSQTTCMDEDNNFYIVTDYGTTHTYLGKTFEQQDSGISNTRMVIKLDSNLTPKWAIPVGVLTGSSSPNASIVHRGNSVYIDLNGTEVFADGNVATGANTYIVELNDATGDVRVIEPMPNNYSNIRLHLATDGIYFTSFVDNTVTIGSTTYNFTGRRMVNGKLKMNPNYIKGHVYFDLNNNSTQDAGENDVYLQKVSIGNRSYFTNLDGEYIGTGVAGTNTVTPASLKYYTPSPTDYTVNFTTSDSTAANRDFRMVPIGNVNDLEVYITNVTFARPGFTAVYQALVRNVGTTSLSPTLKVNYDSRLDFTTAGPPESSHTGNELTWNITNLKPGDIKRYTMVYSIDTSIDIDDTLLFTASIIPIVGDTTPVNNVDTLNHVVRGSYDPNIKEVNKPEIIDVEEVNGSFPIEYTIHFQNTGTDTAFHVYLIDSLDNDLKIETLEILHSSHDVEMSISENNAIRWDFNDILLVDSNTNEPMSHGFVKYRVWTKDNPGLGDEFTNFADIYFDFNAPIRTNTTSNRIDKVESVELVKNKTVVVYPNPSNGIFNVKADIKAGTTTRIEVIDLTGKLVSTQTAVADANGLTTQVDINTLPQGIYFVKVYANNEVYTAKVVKE